MKRNNKCVRAPWLSTHWDIYVKLNERGSIYLGFNLAEILKMSQNLKKSKIPRRYQNLNKFTTPP